MPICLIRCLEKVTVDPVTIVEQGPRRLIPGNGLDDLLGRPLRGGVFREVAMHDATAIVSQGHEHKQPFVGHRGDGEEIAGDQVLKWSAFKRIASALGDITVTVRREKGVGKSRGNCSKFLMYGMGDAGFEPATPAV